MRLNFGLLVSLTLLASAPAYADTEAEARAILDWPEVGLARAESRDKNVYVYFPYEPRDLPEWLEVAMVDFEAPGRVFRARHCCLMEAPDHRISFSSKKGSVYDSWRLQLIWPGPPPENIGWLGFTLPGRRPIRLRNGWVGIDLDRDGDLEIFFICQAFEGMDAFLGDPRRERDQQLWHADYYQNVEFVSSGCEEWRSW
jgi:hypothetical protein